MESVHARWEAASRVGGWSPWRPHTLHGELWKQPSGAGWGWDRWAVLVLALASHASLQLASGCFHGSGTPQPCWLGVGQSSMGAGVAAVVGALMRALQPGPGLGPVAGLPGGQLPAPDAAPHPVACGHHGDQPPAPIPEVVTTLGPLPLPLHHSALHYSTPREVIRAGGCCHCACIPGQAAG